MTWKLWIPLLMLWVEIWRKNMVIEQMLTLREASLSGSGTCKGCPRVPPFRAILDLTDWRRTSKRAIFFSFNLPIFCPFISLWFSIYSKSHRIKAVDHYLNLTSFPIHLDCLYHFFTLFWTVCACQCAPTCPGFPSCTEICYIHPARRHVFVE